MPSQAGKPRLAPQSPNAQLYFRIGGSEPLGPNFYRKLEWVSFANGGYIVRAQMADAYWANARDVVTEDYLRNARRKPVELEFQIILSKKLKTAKRIAIMTELDTSGWGANGFVSFIGIDPPNFWLASGDASGAAFKGKISKVIEQVVKKYTGDIIDVQITETTDNPDNIWYMYRQDPKTFIKSLLDFSSSLTPKKSNWIISSGSKNGKPILRILEQADFKELFHWGDYPVTNAGTTPIKDIKFLGDNSISPLQTTMVTAGISAVTGQIIGQTTEQTIKQEGKTKGTIVFDENTKGKRKPCLVRSNEAFSKPNPEVKPGILPGSTFVRSVPEFSAGDIGKSYDQWIDGRARGLFMDMLPMVMRIRVTIDGDPQFDDSEKLGVSTVGLTWTGGENKNYFLNGRWLLYGFHHELTPTRYFTHLYLARLDWNAASTPSQGS